MQANEAFVYQWPYLLTFLPDFEALERSAWRMGALRRCREIPSASALLKLAMVYGFCGYSLRATAAWAAATGTCQISDVGLLKRFRAASDWLLEVLSLMVASRVASPQAPVRTTLRVRLLDATTLSKPGSTGTDWRLHVAYDLEQRRIASLEVTDRSGGESLTRFQISRGELAVADRAYATRRGFASVLAAGGHFLVRFAWSNVPLETSDGAPFDLLAWLRSLPDATSCEAAVRIRLPNRSTAPVRVLACRKTEVAAERAREKLLRNASKQGQKMDPRSVEAAGYVFLLTSVPVDQLSAAAGLDLYRFRWQIEICFKHLKSLVSLDSLAAKDPRLSVTFIAAKLLGALVIEDFTARYVSFFPWGYSTARPADLLLATP